MNQPADQALVSYRVHNGIARIAVNHPPVNALAHAVRFGIQQAVAAAAADAQVRAIVLTGEGRTFCAGADIREFDQPPQAPRLAQVIVQIEDCAKPVVAALHGTALGGGLELALGCHARIADSQARFGLPEVKLGLLPGAGGTQRLPRLVGLAAALPMVVEGKLSNASEAHRIGLIDAVVDGSDLDSAAQALAVRLAADGQPLRRASRLPAPPLDESLFATAEQAVRRRRRGFEAPLACLAALRAALTLPFAEGVVVEQTLFAQLKASPQSRAQRHAFFAERAAAKLPFSATPRPIARVAVIGAGTMGGGIAMCCANAGITVLLLEQDEQALLSGMARIEANYDRSVRHGRLSAAEADARKARIQASTCLDDLRDADLVIEAVFEDLALKQDVFRTLDRLCKPGAILASNTSYLNIDALASVTGRPEDVVGMHFFSPAHVMRLVENVRASASSDSACATAMALGRHLGKVAVLVGLCEGFVGNRMLGQRTREAYFLLQEGASPEQIDRVLVDFGFPMGPFAMADLAGLDVGWRNRQRRLTADATLTPRERDCDILDQLVAAGRLGQKTGAGYYDYDAERHATPSEAVQILIAAHRAQSGIPQRVISDEEILTRCLYAMINEAFKLMAEGVVQRASDIDVVWLHGYGFPAYRGGPLFYADQIGLDVVLAGIRQYATEQGSAYWQPSDLLVDWVAQGRGVYDVGA